MGSVNAANANRLAQLTDISKMAFGAGPIESHRGGEGNIGMINGQVVKFNTHRAERKVADAPALNASGDIVTDQRIKDNYGTLKTQADVVREQKASCDQLRSTLMSLAENLMGMKQDANLVQDLIVDLRSDGGKGSSAAEKKKLDEKQKAFDEIQAKLNHGKSPYLDRKTVVSVVKIISKYNPNAKKAVADGQSMAADKSMRSGLRSFADKFTQAKVESHDADLVIAAKRGEIRNADMQGVHAFGNDGVKVVSLKDVVVPLKSEAAKAAATEVETTKAEAASRAETTGSGSVNAFTNELPLNRQFRKAFEDHVIDCSKDHFFGDDMRCESSEECTELAHANDQQQADINRGDVIKIGGMALERGAQAKNMRAIKEFFGGNEGLSRVFCGLANQKMIMNVLESVSKTVDGMYVAMNSDAVQKSEINIVREPDGRYRLILDYQKTNVKLALTCVDAAKMANPDNPMVEMDGNSGYAVHTEVVFWDATASGDGVWTGNYTIPADDPLTPGHDETFSLGMQVDHDATSIKCNFENVRPFGT